MHSKLFRSTLRQQGSQTAFDRQGEAVNYDSGINGRALILSMIFVFAGSTAVAHPGHWGELAGHDHWVAGAAIGLAGLAALWGALKGKKPKEDLAPEEDPEEEPA